MTGLKRALGARRERLCLMLAVMAILGGASDWGAAAQTPGLALVILGLTLAAYVATRLRDAEHAANRLCAGDRQGLAEALDTIAGRIVPADLPPSALAQDLANAIARDQLDMLFQPIVDIAHGRAIGAEALLRWEHPALGPLTPARFLPIVEAEGLSDSYGLWVLNAACRAARQWQEAGLGGLTVAVNLSAPQLRDPTLGLKLRRALERHQLAPAMLALELGEAAAIADPDRTAAVFGELRAIGVRLTIDDCQGRAPELLAALPIDTLKVDLRGAGIAAALALGRAGNLDIVASGIEAAGQVTHLTALGCTRFQGYYFSRPLPGDAFAALARDSAWRASLRGLAVPESRASA